MTLEFTVGSNPKVIPSFAACIYPMESVFSIIGSEGLEVSLTSLLHGEQKITIHKDIPSSGTAVTKATITAVEDYKKFASVTITSDSYLENEKITTAESVMLFIGEGGFGIKPEKRKKELLLQREILIKFLSIKLLIIKQSFTEFLLVTIILYM